MTDTSWHQFPHEDGFMALGSIALDAGDARRVGCVTVKGPATRIPTHCGAVREPIEACGKTAERA